MHFVLNSSGKIFKLIELFKMIKGLTNHCTMYCKKDKIFIQVMDDAHVSLLDINIDDKWFLEYDSETETISFNTKLLSIILMMYQPKCLLKFMSTDDYLNIILEYPDNSEKMFEIPLVDIDCDVMKSEKIEHSLDFTIKTKKLDKYLSDMQIFGDTLELIYLNNTIYMRSEGDDGKYQLKLTNDSIDELNVEDNLKLRCRLPLKYPAAITKMSSIFKNISLHISEDAPLTFTIHHKEHDGSGDESDNNSGYIRIDYYIAPKVEDEDDDFDYSQFEEENYNDCKNEIVE